MRIKNVFIVLILIVLLSFIFRQIHLTFLEDLREDAEYFLSDYTQFQSNYFESFPENRQDIDFMIEWFKENRETVNYTFLEYGYNIKYDSLSKRSYLYSFGKDRVDNNMESTPFNSKFYVQSFLNSVPISNGSFKEYFFSFFKEYDVILADIKDYNLICAEKQLPFTRKNLVLDIQLFTGCKNLKGSVNEEKFANEIYNFCKKEIVANSETTVKRVLVSINKKSEVTILCPENLSSKYTDDLKSKLIAFFNQKKITYFDYALFPLYLPEERMEN
ncbi:hypothetical protein [uncultured Maribacter sp.]|uniref:hypothetical protein n=1 Tax=uncultured Maribacter sp. TaxID=431308 RepID=UPI00262E6C6C|nr:hypothetical protein [uncultured Maribacter sp.]